MNNIDDVYEMAFSFAVRHCGGWLKVKNRDEDTKPCANGLKPDEHYVDIKCERRGFGNPFGDLGMHFRVTLFDLMLNCKVLLHEDESETVLDDACTIANLCVLNEYNLVRIEPLPFDERIRLHKRAIAGIQRDLDAGVWDKNDYHAEGQLRYRIGVYERRIELLEAWAVEESRLRKAWTL